MRYRKIESYLIELPNSTYSLIDHIISFLTGRRLAPKPVIDPNLLRPDTRSRLN
ncbi:MAG: hypothetical protein P0Y53_20275 [Candidatus Pseudobacter hemicellulosilyticus]|uniref:Uncharacterized protein n=1 Tax=Candidatus Pseudobacter hemicellulosilyticus TaxID=3121375 RepID=A0AAJ5WQ14_9BACT|nr:MAG: hypothetical protein P0Y53_20275 [Pseudobacter sp.]